MKDIIRATVGNNGLIELTIIGEVHAEDIEQLKSKLVEISELIASEYRTQQAKLKILIDITDFAGDYDIAAIPLMINFAKQNRIFVLKTASFGGPLKAQMAGEAVAGLAGRNNIALFDTREDALKWLYA